ncbi:acyl-CoA thioesterase [Desulfovibrio ferrophilus]|uniref:4-hydroxybenzoyl-CoA thioesterase n=1 Tax=Desulfovibrio ferrophilus TaxID=241368 RepID=A0A2Z6AUC8_9BACT|nr:thioesterase family protein [Desulfovibrio ferrophilus]BBD06829.1 4-hydroxybenzoyl-CoA thioesterase [Desulfovibrio ferrophilus]
MSDFPSPETWYQHRVSYGETDAMQVLYYAEYLHLFERSRSQFIREYGMSYNTVEERGIFLPVREASARYRRPARYDDLLQVRVGISEWGRASMTFTYEVYDEARKVLHTTGMTQHACMSTEGKPVKVPDWLKELFT